ncbi:hypothetical protein NECAME_00846 [Necator americanus]|uniref:Uncharacterized protein n=1 Tax=Necator americanus TaxID=51031 RepID=W2SR28_NECAM|nr:hypothetical protein NECAME_00846 [Necator americanus]ETN71157.1 hypothetical protein NECAME_00846 [Necator americanus]
MIRENFSANASGMHFHPVIAEPPHVDVAPVAIAPIVQPPPVVAPQEVIHPPPVVAPPEVIQPPPVVAPQKVIVPPPAVAPVPVPVPIHHEHPRTEVRNVVSHYAKEAGHTSATAMVSGDDHHGLGHGLIGHGLLGHGHGGLLPGGLMGGDMHYAGGLGGGIIGRKAAVKAAKKKTT